MISRRLLRIKVMQSLFTKHLNSGVQVNAQKKNLTNNIHNVYTIFLHMVYTMRQVANYTLEYDKIVKGKFIKTGQKVDTSILQNPLIQQLNEHPYVMDLFKTHKSAAFEDIDVIRKLYKDFKDREEYVTYTNTPEKTQEQEWKILRILFKKIILKNELLASQLEEAFITWEDDRNTVINMVIALINEFYKQNNLDFDKSLPRVAWEELDQYAIDLFLKVLNNKAELDTMIEPMLENWEMDRVNLIDLILVRMALVELLHFPNIPVKVTLNEFVEISKVYSTPKSKEFINGILDRLMKKLQQENKIKKTGRGLIE